MRRPERRMKEETLFALLRRSQVGRVATIDEEGYPVIKPVNFIFMDGNLYFHSSPDGEKIEDIRRGSLVCFELDEAIAYAPSAGPACRAGFFYRSVLIKGRASLLKRRKEKLKVLQGLMEKYQPEGGYEPLSEAVVEQTAVVEISVEQMTGKERMV